MYTLFKKLRRKFLSENDSNGYYKYAIGEVFLVMVGILLALQVDNWNEQRKEKKLEKEILVNLQNEIQSNLHTVNRIVNGKRQVLSAVKVILEHTGAHSTWNSIMDFDSLLAITLFSGYKYSPEDGIMKNLINSGKISLIENDSLRFLITSLPHDIILIQGEDDVYRSELHLYILPIVGELYPTRNFTTHLEYRGLNFNLGKSGFDIEPKSLLNNPEFESILTTQHTWITVHINFYNILAHKYRTILELIESELSG